MEKKKKPFVSGRDLYLIISLLVLAALLVIGTLTIGPKLVGAARDPEKLRQELGGNNPKSWFIFIGIQFLQVIFAFIPGELIEVAAGYIYGPFLGTVLCLIGVLPATCLIFGLTKLLGRKFTKITLDEKDLKKFSFLNDEKKLTTTLFLLYFFPGTPKDVITYFAGITKIKFLPFLLISVLCRIPSVLTSTLAGGALGQNQFLLTLVIFGVTAVTVLLGWVMFKKISKNKKPSQ
ncbi:MAG: TVP38/TMEM64 family protein [Clostridia bacterium]|nr:TVP38/TMEM64 family protein [Clostridia bacterium]